MLQAALLWHSKFRSNLEEVGFAFNPYDPCVANRNTGGKQHTIRFHVDDLLSSHEDPTVNDNFLQWLEFKYGSKSGSVKAVRGKVHDYLGMTLEYGNGEPKINMADYVQNMLDEFPLKFNEANKQTSPATVDMFGVDNSKKLSKEEAEMFHRMVAKGLFICKRGRPDIQPTIAALTTRVKEPNKSDWRKLVRLMKWLATTKNDKLTLSAENIHLIKWFVDVAFAVHPDFKSHTGVAMKFGGGKGSVINLSRKRKLNTRSSTESEVVGVDDALILILWTRLFMEAQGYPIEQNILYQDNKSAILLEENGKKSSSKRTRAINIRYFFIGDQVTKKNVEVQYCPTDEMTGDYMSEGLQGEKFRRFRDEIMGFTGPDGFTGPSS